jgi:hypothetical protein
VFGGGLGEVDAVGALAVGVGEGFEAEDVAGVPQAISRTPSSASLA